MRGWYMLHVLSVVSEQCQDVRGNFTLLQEVSCE